MLRALGTATRVGWRPSGLYRLPTEAGTVPYRIVRANPVTGGGRNDRRPALVIGLHGFGSDERQVETMLALDLPAPVVYLAPRGGFEEGAGFSWFELAVAADEKPAPVAGAVGEALVRLRAFARAAQTAWDTDPSWVALVGYSQGGALALAAAARAGEPFTAVATLSGGTQEPGPPRVPLFVGYGTLDPLIPAETVRRRLATWTSADVTASEARAPHVVTARQRSDLGVWLRERLEVRPRSV